MNRNNTSTYRTGCCCSLLLAAAAAAAHADRQAQGTRTRDRRPKRFECAIDFHEELAVQYDTHLRCTEALTKTARCYAGHLPFLDLYSQSGGAVLRGPVLHTVA